MTDYYTTSDFDDYKLWFNENDISIDKFIESINNVIDETDNVCDFQQVIYHVKKYNKELRCLDDILNIHFYY